MQRVERRIERKKKLIDKKYIVFYMSLYRDEEAVEEFLKSLENKESK